MAAAQSLHRRGGHHEFYELGDTGLPEVPVSGGAQTEASVSPAVHAAAIAAAMRKWTACTRLDGSGM
jgi:hypothetical protein